VFEGGIERERERRSSCAPTLQEEKEDEDISEEEDCNF
jgi:hypothetical protein